MDNTHEMDAWLNCDSEKLGKAFKHAFTTEQELYMETLNDLNEKLTKYINRKKEW